MKKSIFSFVIFCFILSVPFYFMIDCWTKPGRNASTFQENIPIEAKEIKLFCINITDEELKSVFELAVSPTNNSITIKPIPISLAVEHAGSLQTIGEMFDNLGAEKAIKEVFGEEMYTIYNNEDLKEIADSTGRINFNISEDIYSNTDQLLLPKGYTQLDGRRIVQLITSRQYDFNTEFGMQNTAILLKDILNAHLHKDNSIEFYYNIIVNNSKNNISYQKFHELIPIFEELLSSSADIEIEYIQGEYVEKDALFIPKNYPF